MGEAAAVGLLIGLLDDPLPDIRHLAAKALGLIGDPAAVEPLLAALAQELARDGDDHVYSYEGPLPLILDGRQTYLDIKVEEAIIIALGRIGDSRSLPVLQKLTDSGREDAAYIAGEASNQIRLGETQLSRLLAGILGTNVL